MTNTIATATTIKATALSKVPGYNDHANMLATLGVTRIRDGIPVVQYSFTQPAAAAAVATEIRNLLRAGQQIPDDIAAPIAAAERHDAEQIARVRAIDSVAREFNTSMIFHEDAIKPATEYLRAEMSRVIDEVKDNMTHLNGATTAGEVLSTGGSAVDAWRALGVLADDYAEIRGVQKEFQKMIGTATVSFTNEKFARTALFADSLNVTPYWVNRRRQSGLGWSSPDTEVSEYQAWMTSAHPSPAFSDGLEREYQMVLIATTTTPWVPSPSEYERADAAAIEATGRPTINTVYAIDEARRLYFTVTGATDTSAGMTSEPTPRITAPSYIAKRNGELSTRE